jgi:hypothetical protein
LRSWTAWSSSSCSTRTLARRGGSERARQLEDPGPGRDEDLRDEDRPGPRARVVLARRRRGRVRDRPRPERMRQDDPALGDVGAPRPQPGRDPTRWHERQGPTTARDRNDVPGRQPASLAQPAEEHRAAVRDQEAPRRRETHQAPARPGRAVGVRDGLSARALGRDAAAGVDRAGA